MERATRVVFTRVLVELSRQLRDSDLTVAQVAALHVVDQAGGLRSSAVGEALGMSASAVSRMIDGLVARGLVLRDEDPEDRRARRIRLSEEGLAFLRDAGAARVRVLAETMEAHAPASVVRGLLRAMETILAK